jgi:hypothetical protein
MIDNKMTLYHLNKDGKHVSYIFPFLKMFTTIQKNQILIMLQMQFVLEITIICLFFI